MKRYIVLIKNNNYNPNQRKEIFNKIKNILNNYRLIDIRIATKHIEIDLLSKDLSFLNYLEIFNIISFRDLSIKEKDIIKKSKELFNQERFWEVHEILENLWRERKGKDKKFLHGIILLAASFVHYQRGNDKIAISILKRSLKELEEFEGNYLSFNVNLIKEKIKEMINKNKIEIFDLK